MIKCEGCHQEPDEYTSYPVGYAAPVGWVVLTRQMRDNEFHSILQHLRVFCSEECVRAFYTGQRTPPPYNPDPRLLEGMGL